ncbi:MAG: hypothetical protein U0P81_07170 [Holophagaceae bacterium]
MIPPPALIAPQSQVVAEGRPALSLLGLLAFRQGGIILVEPDHADSWRSALATEAMEDLKEDLLIRWIKPGDASLAPLGIQEAGVYLVDSAGSRLAAWTGPPPARLEVALREAGWTSLDDQYERLIRQYPSRVDLAWAMFQRAQARFLGRPTEARADACARAVDRLLAMDAWASGRSVFIGLEGGGETAKAFPSLSAVAKRHQSALEAQVRQQPECIAAWNLLAFLLPYQPRPTHWAALLGELTPGPESDAAFWPMAEVIRMAVEQRRNERDWTGLRAFAMARLELLESRANRYHDSAAEAWSGRMTVAQDKVTYFTRRDESRSGRGFWLSAWFEASLESGRPGEAASLARRVAVEGDESSRLKCIGLARTAKREDLVAIIKGE